MKKLISIGECMLELSSVKDDIWKMGIAGDTLNTSWYASCLLYTSPSPRDKRQSRMPSSA